MDITWHVCFAIFLLQYGHEEIIIEALQEIIQGLQSLLHAAAAGPRIVKPYRDSD